ncbi:MAG: ABC-2 family transporter protein [Pirellula sp.]|nr:ABC-2 family transporter protein [Pirellula sp.]
MSESLGRPPSSSYLKVFLAGARNSLIRDMTFRSNFFLDCISSLSWLLMNLGFYLLVFFHVRSIGVETGWGRNEFFVFLATTWLINSIIQAFLMPNAQEFSELIRTGGLDYVLLKPMDTQFLISFRRVEWSSLSNFVLGLIILIYALLQLQERTAPAWQWSWISFGLFWFYVACGVLLLYSLMICLAATSVWLGRNQSLYDFWFYITNFSRYPMEIYEGGWGYPLWLIFTFVVPVLVVVNVPARILAQPLSPREPWEWGLAMFAFVATVVSLLASRWIFRRALRSYSSASS